MKKINQNKKGVELTLQTIIMLIIAILVLIMMIYFFSGNFTENTSVIKDTGSGVLNKTLFPSK